MLTIQQISSFSQTHQLFRAYENPIHQRQQTWIVSDLKTKQDAQDFLIENAGYCLDEAILRVSEFWKLWIHRLDPKIQFVHQQFINSALENFLNSKKDELGIGLEEIKTSISYLWQMAAFLINKDHQAIVDEWIKQEDKNIQWQKWFLINKLSMNYLLQELKVMHTSWSSFYLSTLEIEKIQWSKNIIFDLGTEISSVEFGIIQVLAQKMNITVLEPAAEFTQRYPTLLRPYQIYRGFVDQVIPAPVVTQNQMSSGNQFFRFHNALAEIKWVTQQVRQWLDAGINPARIMLSSPQVEIYWPILRMHLQFEGIPFDKSQAIKFKDLKFFQILRSRLNFFNQNQNWTTAETVAIHDEVFHQKVQNRFSQFKKLFFEITEFEELQLDDQLWGQWQKKRLGVEPIDRHYYLKRVIFEFLSIHVDFESSDEINQFFVATLKDFLAKTVDCTLSFKMWTEIFIETVEKLDFRLQDFSGQGVKIRGMNLSFINSITHKINFGCDQRGLAPAKKILLPSEDLRSLKKDFEFSINESDELNYEFYLRQSLFYQFEQQITTLAHVNLTGDINETPVIILENRLEPDVHFELNSRLDQVQRSNQIVSSENSVLIKSRYLRADAEVITAFAKSELSASSLSQFASCPFLFYAQAGLGFRDEENLSIDLGFMQRGLVFHALFDHLSKKDFQFTLDELEIFLEQSRLDFQLYLRSDVLWKAFKSRMIKMALAFCDFEKNRGSLKMIRHSEVAFEFQFQSEPDLLAKIKGRIDRIDIDPNTREAIVYDYKSSSSGVSAAKSWIKNNEFQFFIYIMGLETDEMKQMFDIKTVTNAQYFIFKDFTLKPGFKDEVEKNTLMTDFENHLRFLLKQLDSKLFPAKPTKTEDCKSCHWKETCRAPHLN